MLNKAKTSYAEDLIYSIMPGQKTEILHLSMTTPLNDKGSRIIDYKSSDQTESLNAFDGTEITQRTVLENYPVPERNAINQIQNKTTDVVTITRPSDIEKDGRNDSIKIIESKTKYFTPDTDFNSVANLIDTKLKNVKITHM